MHEKDLRNDPNWFGNFYSDSSTMVLRLLEPAVEKPRSFKVEGAVEKIEIGGKFRKVSGNVLLYFSKERSIFPLKYGDRIMIRGGLQQIRNSGNPGGFDYEQYMSFQQTFHRSFLKQGQYWLLKNRKENAFFRFIFFARQKIIDILKQNIKGDKKVTGITEALLIGYKEDLDKDTVQAYSNTGVVHIIAISGMHLGLIYVVLVWLLSRFPYVKKIPFLRMLLILSGLWIFSLITGSSASVIRSAVMFTCIITGKIFFKQASIYNSLATSSFLLLCFDPWLLWDVGFQLSYLAVIGIVWLQRPIFNLWYIRNKYGQKIWELSAICIAAQVLTLPICIYYFHQVPTTFLLSNLICVPLSTVILFAEIGVLIFSFSNYLSALAGKFTYVLTWLMNLVINACNNIPFALINGICLSATSTALLYVSTLLLCSGFLHRNKRLLKYAMISLLIFACLWSYDQIISLQQKKIVIYNISKHTAVDFVVGNNFFYYGETDIKKDKPVENFHLSPARISLRALNESKNIVGLKKAGRLWQFYTKMIMIIDTATTLEPLKNKIRIDILLLSHDPKISINDITIAVSPAVIVFDGSNSLWKIGQWKKECEQLHLRCYSTDEQGAYIIDVALK